MLQHVSIEVPPDAAERAIEFWRLVGFEEVESPEPLGDAVRWLEREGTQIHLILTEGHTAPALGHTAIVVADHGAYIWGDDVLEAKRHTEVYHFLFEATVARHDRSARLKEGRP